MLVALLRPMVARPVRHLAKSPLALVSSRHLFGFVQSALGSLVGSPGKDDDSLKNVFMDLADGAESIPTSDLASKLAKAYGYDDEAVTGSGVGVAYGTDPLSYAVKLHMLWAVRKMDVNADELISWGEVSRGTA